MQQIPYSSHVQETSPCVRSSSVFLVIVSIEFELLRKGWPSRGLRCLAKISPRVVRVCLRWSVRWTRSRRCHHTTITSTGWGGNKRRLKNIATPLPPHPIPRKRLERFVPTWLRRLQQREHLLATRSSSLLTKCARSGLGAPVDKAACHHGTDRNRNTTVSRCGGGGR